MSEIQVGQINSTDGSTAITTGADGYVSFAKTQIGGRRNLIINGAMQVAQRGTSFTGLTDGSGATYTLDRWEWFETGTALTTHTVSQDTDAPTGFNNSLKITTTTANASPSGLTAFAYRIEAQDLQSLGYGSSDAKQTTLSFWVKSSQTGVGAILFYQYDGAKSVTLNYTINSADTWEYKTLAIPANTTNAHANDNSAGFEIDFTVLADTSVYGTTSNATWGAYSNGTRAYGQTINIRASTSDYWQITGVQLEVGTVATPHEHISYGEQLALCQRYYQAVVNGSGNSVGSGSPYTAGGSLFVPWQFRQEMRSTPTIISSGAGTFRARRGNLTAFDGWIGFNNINSRNASLTTASVSGSSVGDYYWIESNDASALLAFDAEL